MTDIETAIMIENMARETVRRMMAKVKNADPKYTVIGGPVWYEDDDYKIPLETFRGKNKNLFKVPLKKK